MLFKLNSDLRHVYKKTVLYILAVLASKFEKREKIAQFFFHLQFRILENAEFYADFKTVEQITKCLPTNITSQNVKEFCSFPFLP